MENTTLKVHFNTIDSATGHNHKFDAELPAMTPEAVAHAIRADLARSAGHSIEDEEEHVCLSLVPTERPERHCDDWGFVVRTGDLLFGALVVVGTINIVEREGE